MQPFAFLMGVLALLNNALTAIVTRRQTSDRATICENADRPHATANQEAQSPATNPPLKGFMVHITLIGIIVVEGIGPWLKAL